MPDAPTGSTTHEVTTYEVTVPGKRRSRRWLHFNLGLPDLEDKLRELLLLADHLRASLRYQREDEATFRLTVIGAVPYGPPVVVHRASGERIVAKWGEEIEVSLPLQFAAREADVFGGNGRG